MKRQITFNSTNESQKSEFLRQSINEILLHQEPKDLIDEAVINWFIPEDKNARVVLGGNRSIVLDSLAIGDSGNIVVVQDSVGSRTLNIPANSKLANVTASQLILSTLPNAVDLFTYYYDGEFIYWEHAIDENRILILENNEYKITYFTEISNSTGTITIPAEATILLNQMQGGADAFVSTIQNGQPTGDFPRDSLGITVDVASFDALGNYTLTGVPSSYPVALIYVLKIKPKFYSNLNINNIIDFDDIDGEDIQLLIDQASTGLTEFGGLSIGTPTSTFSVGFVKGWFIDSTTNPLFPTRTYKSFVAQSNIAVTNIATQNVTYVGIDSSGTIIQSSSPFGPPLHRTIIRLGVIVHSNRVIVNAVNNQPNSVLNIGGQLNDFIEAVGTLNLSGNVISANGANLSINKSAGVYFKSGCNFMNDNKNPHELSLAALTAPSNMRYRLRDGTEFSNTAFIDPNNYDLGGILTVVPATKYTIHRIYLFQSNLIRIQYGQVLYDSMDDARAHIDNNGFITEQNLTENGLMICALVVRAGCTDLTNTDQAKFTPIARDGRTSETNTGTGLFRKQILNNASSGLMTGAAISIASASTVNITSGKGLVVDNTTDPSNPTLIEVSWSAFTGTAITNVGSQMGTALYINSDGTLFQDNITNLPDGTLSRSKIFIGAVGHPTGSLINVYAVPDAIINPVSGMNDFAKAIGPFPISGNKISKNTGALTLSKSAGLSFFLNSNYQTDKTDPNNLICASLSAPTLQYLKQDAFLGPVSSSISTSQYDNTGTLTAIPTNNFVTHRIWHQPSNNALFFQYSQFTYNSFNDAKIGLNNEDFVVPVPLGYGAYVSAIIITREGETDLDNPTRSLIIPQNKFAGTGSGGGGVAAPTRTNGGNTNYNILVSDDIIYTGTAFTAPRTWTLPDAATVVAGDEYIIADELQTITSSNTLTIAVQTGQKLNGVTNGTEVINSAGGWRRLESNGVDGWFFDAGIGRLGKNQTWIGVNTFNQAIIVNSETPDRIASIDTNKNIKSLNTTTYPSLTELSYVKGVTSAIQTQLDKMRSELQLGQTGAAVFSPADATSYFYGLLTAGVPATNAAARAVILPYNITIKEVSISTWVNTTIGSNEPLTVFLEEYTAASTLVNSTQINNTYTLDAAGKQNSLVISGLSINASSGNFLIIKITTPTWTTNPTNIWTNYVVSFKQQ